MVEPLIRKLLRGFPVHAVHVVYSDIAYITDICQHVLTHKLVVPVQLVFDDIGWNHTAVSSFGSHLRLSNTRVRQRGLQVKDAKIQDVPLQVSASWNVANGQLHMPRPPRLIKTV